MSSLHPFPRTLVLYKCDVIRQLINRNLITKVGYDQWRYLPSARRRKYWGWPWVQIHELDKQQPSQLRWGIRLRWRGRHKVGVGPPQTAYYKEREQSIGNGPGVGLLVGLRNGKACKRKHNNEEESLSFLSFRPQSTSGLLRTACYSTEGQSTTGQLVSRVVQPRSNENDNNKIACHYQK